MTRVRKRQPLFDFSWKNAVHFFFMITFIVAGVLFFNQFNSVPKFPIKDVKIIGAKHINHQEVQRSLISLVNNGFFSVEVDSIKNRLLQNPWVSEVNVRRIWPDQVWVTIIEKNPVAQWNESSLLSSAGDLFTPGANRTSKDIPALWGPEGKQLYVMEYYNKLNNLLTPLHVKIMRLELTPAHLWSVILDNGVKLTVDHKDLLTHFSHFVKVYPKVVGTRAADIEYIDLRYQNGLAVRWKTVT